MRLRNKKTGEIGTLTLSSNGEDLLIMKSNEMVIRSVKLSDLEGWEDYEEQRYWYINPEGEIGNISIEVDGPEGVKASKSIGNYFDKREEAEFAVCKLKAFKRLEDKGLRFCGHDDRDRGQLGDIVIYAEMPTFEYDDDSTRNDLDLLFGGEE